ncbi:helix-turn-helix transcriptional regulator [Streptomyces avidinii]|uniref:helix-turn-helix transcriptional regulator n=1 Tax=Streptomyces avidinii TaxID=1895 RepID=UPI003792B81E
MTMTHDPVAGVDMLLAGPADLPPLGARSRLRRAAGLTQQQVADAIGVQYQQVYRWEQGAAEPRGKRRAAYIKLLQALASRHPEVALGP